MLLYFVKTPTLGKLLSQKQPSLSLLKDNQLHQNPFPIGFFFQLVELEDKSTSYNINYTSTSSAVSRRHKDIQLHINLNYYTYLHYPQL